MCVYMFMEEAVFLEMSMGIAKRDPEHGSLMGLYLFVIGLYSNVHQNKHIKIWSRRSIGKEMYHPFF